ncbi:MAG: hypothetical protein KA298_06325, partial [Paludibacteraceae bacterium]|nr:hypothetical protein [Paludibacteraceae bacterium]MBP6435931.1 hypothetical protein [Paludibacteraceae bacterium]
VSDSDKLANRGDTALIFLIYCDLYLRFLLCERTQNSPQKYIIVIQHTRNLSVSEEKSVSLQS